MSTVDLEPSVDSDAEKAGSQVGLLTVLQQVLARLAMVIATCKRTPVPCELGKAKHIVGL